MFLCVCVRVCVCPLQYTGITGNKDNCPDVFNPEQKDWDRDDVGDACDNCLVKYNREQVRVEN